MRVTTDLWVAALTRRIFSGGGFAAVVRRGAAESGAVFVLARDRFGEVRLFGPAPQSAYRGASPEDRLFVRLGEAAEAIEARLDRERKFDPDVWVVEIEPGAGPVEALLDVRTP